jgi:hypothetical protein
MGSPSSITWSLWIGGDELPAPPDEGWEEAVRSVARAEWGVLVAEQDGTGEKLYLPFDGDFASLDHWASEDGPVLGAVLPNRPALTDEAVELPCCGCGIPSEVPGRRVLHKADAVRLFLRYLPDGELPGELPDPPGAIRQPALPGLEEFFVPPVVLNAVAWHPVL